MRALALLLALAAAAPASAQGMAARLAARSGRYDAALSGFARAAGEAPGDARLHRAWAQTLLELGRHDEAERLIRGFAPGPDPELMTVLGELQAATGRLDEAAASFDAAIDGGATDALVALAGRGQLRERRGDWDGAEADYDSLIDAYNQRSQLSAEELVAVGLACRQLGPTNHQLYRDALKAWDEATSVDPGHLEARVLVGELFLEKYNGPSARESIDAVLAVNPNHPRGRLAKARILDFDGETGGIELAREVLETNPALVPARVYLGEAMLGLERWDEAQEHAEAALGTDPTSLEALAVLAAVHFLRGDEAAFASVRDRALALNPRGAELFNTVADICVRNRLYREAAEFARQAVQLDPRSWRGHGILGLNLLRLGRIEEGRRSLEIAFEGDPYDVWNKNTLDLLDTFGNYVITESPRFRFFADREESPVLTPYMSALAEEALDDLQARYRYTPGTPIRVEVYPSHADFSVRTVGLAGLGALGVCFGEVLALDSPSARERGKFNWGSTLWHELAHTITLGLSGHRVPRWLTEGISVREEWRARPGWGDDVGLGFLAAFKREALLPVAQLNDGFVRPKNPMQIGLSYVQAGLVVEWIERERGFDAVLALLHGYRDRRDPEQVFEQALGLGYEEFDEAFFADLAERWAGPLEAIVLRDEPPAAGTQLDLMAAADSAPGDFVAQLAAGKALLAGRQPERAREFLERARELFPGYHDEDSPLWYLARIAADEGDQETARAHLQALTALNENHWDAHLALADAAEALGDPKGAAAALERALAIDPLEPALHVRLAGLYARTGQHEPAVRERRAIVALDPVDRAEALYQLALALRDAGRPDEAKREVMRALESAPRFQRAQELLLELHRAARGDAGAREGETP